MKKMAPDSCVIISIPDRCWKLSGTCFESKSEENGCPFRQFVFNRKIFTMNHSFTCIL